MPAKKDKLPARIVTVLRKGIASDAIIDVSASGIRDNLHVLVVSKALDDMTERKKQEFLWGLLEDAVKRKELSQRDLDRISVVLPVSVDELRR